MLTVVCQKLLIVYVARKLLMALTLSCPPCSDCWRRLLALMFGAVSGARVDPGVSVLRNSKDKT